MTWQNGERIILNPARKSKQRRWSTKAELIIIARGLDSGGSRNGQEGERDVSF
jgi:hypothetical protein